MVLGNAPFLSQYIAHLRIYVPLYEPLLSFSRSPISLLFISSLNSSDSFISFSLLLISSIFINLSLLPLFLKNCSIFFCILAALANSPDGPYFLYLVVRGIPFLFSGLF